MGSHAKPRATGRKTALGALALGATLTGVGLTAAALDPATAVLTASGPDQSGATQLSGLSSPVADDLGPAADGMTVLSPAPLGNVSSLTNSLNGSTGGALQSAGSPAKTATSGTLDVSSKAPGTQTGVKPIKAGTPVSGSSPASSSSSSSSSSSGSSGSSGYIGRHVRTRSAAPPSDSTPLAGQVSTGAASTASSVLPLVQGVVSNVPVVSSLVQGSGVGSTVGGLPLVGSVLGGSGSGQSTLTVPGLSSLGGLL